jgi:hypothetical protein
MIQSAFKQQVYNDSLHRFESCQVIVRFENNGYRACILSLCDGTNGPSYIQLDTPEFPSQSELKAHIRAVLRCS